MFDDLERADVFRAVADPTRRAMLELLRETDRSVNELVERFPVSQPAISRHLRVLREAGLVRPRKAGRQRVYTLEAGPLQEVYDWVEHYRRFWPRRLKALGEYLDRQPEPRSEEA
ncbi:MAG TPA: metalloregulator ArsR/SmtB family transcription factor [Longimicrobiaceae bacterium]|nr:metalloregulator ArsR/SmtB family transcription factor [Longimicrobiaceae bacterium]